MFREGGVRFGKTGRENSKEGKWLSGDADFDKDGNVYAKGRIWREEYFKNGLRDSIFRQFDDNGKIIYETTFKNGTGLWKEFHNNGRLYYEIKTKAGFFSDTLKLYDFRGRLQAKKLYNKDSLVYTKDFDTYIVDSLENGKTVKITYRQKWINSYNRPYYIYEKQYQNKLERYNEKNYLVYLKEDTLINGVKKEFTQIVKEENSEKKTEETLYSYTENPTEKLFDYYRLYVNNQLIKYRYFVKGVTPKIFTIGYNEGREIVYKSSFDTNNYKNQFPYITDKTNYFEKGKKIYSSVELIEKVIFEEHQNINIIYSQISYYDLKGNLFKKEFVEHRKDEYLERCSRGNEVFDVDILQLAFHYIEC